MALDNILFKELIGTMLNMLLGDSVTGGAMVALLAVYIGIF